MYLSRADTEGPPAQRVEAVSGSATPELGRRTDAICKAQMYPNVSQGPAVCRTGHQSSNSGALQRCNARNSHSVESWAHTMCTHRLSDPHIYPMCAPKISHRLNDMQQLIRSNIPAP